jgi:hypothetical protein
MKVKACEEKWTKKKVLKLKHILKSMQQCKIVSFKWIFTLEVENPKMFWNFETKFGE